MWLMEVCGWMGTMLSFLSGWCRLSLALSSFQPPGV